MKKRMILIAVLLLCVITTAQATGFVTPLYPQEQEKHDQFWKYMDLQLGPWLSKEPQEKWSAARCRQVADQMEKDGFVISEEYKDKLYRTQRVHRWHATEAYSLLCESQIGEQWQWSLYDRWRMQQAKRYSGIMAYNDGMPGPEDPTVNELVQLTRQLLQKEYGLTNEQMNEYDYGVHLNILTERQLWTVNVYPDLEHDPYRNDFCVEYYWPDHEWSVTDWRPNHLMK